jgi:hypothetical protein
MKKEDSMDQKTAVLVQRTERAQTAIQERAAREWVNAANRRFAAWAALEGFTGEEWANAKREAAR